MPEHDAENGKSTEVSSTQAAKKSSNLLPIAVGGGVFIIFVAVFSIIFGVFSSGNVAETPGDSAQQTAEKKEVGGDNDLEAEYSRTTMFGDEDNSEDYLSPGETEFTADDSIAQVTWYQAQKEEINRERAELATNRSNLQRLRDETEALLNRRSALEDGNIAAMAKLYENMNSEEVVPILSNLDDAQVSLIISKMKKRQASEVMGKLPPERAAKITQWLISLETN